MKYRCHLSSEEYIDIDSFKEAPEEREFVSFLPDHPLFDESPIAPKNTS